MDDDALLDAAAKAAGHARTNTNVKWNPLEDDADALRLAATLRITVGEYPDLARQMVYAMAPGVPWCVESSQANPEAAYRRVIVRCAASMMSSSSAERALEIMADDARAIGLSYDPPDGGPISSTMPAADQAALDAAVAAERARWRMMLAGPHLYRGDCPDEIDWTARDPECPACQSLSDWRVVMP